MTLFSGKKSFFVSTQVSRSLRQGDSPQKTFRFSYSKEYIKLVREAGRSILLPFNVGEKKAKSSTLDSFFGA